MTADGETGVYGSLLFDLQDSTDYFVTAGGVRSPVHRLTVADLPYVDHVMLEYHFPAYTGLEPVRQDEGGDVAALVDTRVRVSVVPTLPVGGGALAVGADTIAMQADSGGLVGDLVVRASGSYRVLLAGPDGRLVPASPEFFIDALDDQPPTVRMSRPGRDVSVTSVDELPLEVTAEDDFGLARVELVVSVNGGADTVVPLYRGRGGRKELTAGHTIYLEELGLQPGDIVAYYARARDGRPKSEPASTDIYFARIRPYDQRWRAAEAAGGQQGAGGGASPGELSQRQREIVAATFRLVRDRSKYTDREWRDNLSTVTLMQGRLRQEVETLVQRIDTRGVVELDSTMAAVAAALPPAIEAMKEAEERLGRRQGQEALPPEQRALQFLQRAEAAFRDRQVTQGQEGGGGGGGGGEANAEELAQLFELELDRLRNQYESVERGRREEANQAVDEALEKLRELARRQQQENERQRAQAQAQGQAGSGGSDGQRRLAQQTEELARQLERLSRERQDEALRESARRVREAADAMRRASADRGGTPQGSRALDRLSEARRQLENTRGAGLRRDLDDAQQRAERLAEEQRRMREDVSGLSQAGAEREERLRRLEERKEQMAEEVERLESDLDRLSREARGEQPAAADRLRQTARAARDTRLRDKIRYSRGVIRERSQEYADAFEEQIADDIEAMRQGIADARGQAGQGGGQAQEMERALDRTREITRALESLGERGREAAGDSGAGAGAGRQLRRELRDRLGELRELRNQLRGQGVDTGPLDGILDRLGRMDNQGTVGTPRGLDELDRAVVQGLKEFEFALRRQLLGGDTPPGALGAAEGVPPEYRAMVEEYYRRLSQRRR
jgi:hypothetical protein